MAHPPDVIRRAPACPTGTTGAPVTAASRASPVRNGSGGFSPASRRGGIRPSAYSITGRPEARATAAWSRAAAARADPRCTGTCPSRDSARPRPGIRHSPAVASTTGSTAIRRRSAARTSAGSAREVWFTTRMLPGSIRASGSAVTVNRPKNGTTWAARRLSTRSP
ncbi:hypothetical protein GCM10022244_31700 [Streptomyces gulbargensis]|uniref:Uncharacterized protein n=1 Tax=Streptomyces gulbargensis TaxID=364901 RepID=A0ABP7MGK0_9ACTN